jgi:uncharacterized protein YbaR (Trm112 family)
MPISHELLEILICPENRTKLQLAPDDYIQRLNSAIADGQLRNRAGDVVQTPLVGGLIREDGKYLYPIVEDIPILLSDEAIPTEQLPAAMLTD